MPQYRKLHTKITQSFDFNEMPDDFARCLWLLLPLGLDCEGRGIYNASWIKSKLMPLREDVDGQKIMDAMEWFALRGMIVVYTVEGRRYFFVPTFKVYQSGTEKESRSVLPAPSGMTVYSGVSQELVKSKEREVQEPVELAASASASESVNASESEFESEQEQVEQKSAVFVVYEQEIGVITPRIADDLKLAIQEYPPGWIEDALHESATHNKRSWKYAQAILRRWQAEGRGPMNDNGHKAQHEKRKVKIKDSVTGEMVEVEV